MRKNRSAAVTAASFLLITGAAIATAPASVAGTPAAPTQVTATGTSTATGTRTC